LPSIKANPTLATRAVLTSEGVGCDTFGETELEVALRAGVPPALISVNGASKSAALIGRAVAAGARITLDSGRELPIAEKAAADAATTARVRIRLRPRLDGVEAPSDFASDGTSIREVFQSYKAGVPIDDAVALGRAALESRHVELVGVHAHLARQTGHQPVARADRQFRRAACRVVGQLGRMASRRNRCRRWLAFSHRPRRAAAGPGADAPTAGGCGRLRARRRGEPRRKPSRSRPGASWNAA